MKNIKDNKDQLSLVENFFENYIRNILFNLKENKYSNVKTKKLKRNERTGNFDQDKGRSIFYKYFIESKRFND